MNKYQESRRHALAAMARYVNTPVPCISSQIKEFMSFTNAEVDTTFKYLRMRGRLKGRKHV